MVDITEDISEMCKARKLSSLTLVLVATTSAYEWNFGSSRIETSVKCLNKPGTREKSTQF